MVDSFEINQLVRYNNGIYRVVLHDDQGEYGLRLVAYFSAGNINLDLETPLEISTNDIGKMYNFEYSAPKFEMGSTVHHSTLDLVQIRWVIFNEFRNYKYTYYVVTKSPGWGQNQLQIEENELY